MMPLTLILSLALVIFGGVHFGRQIARPVFRRLGRQLKGVKHARRITEKTNYHLPGRRLKQMTGDRAFTLRTAMKLKPKWIL